MGHLDSAAKVPLSPRPWEVEGLVAAMGPEAAWPYGCESITRHWRSILASRSFAEAYGKRLLVDACMDE